MQLRTPWREFIQDPELRQLIELSLENNRDLRLAALNVEQVRALYKIQREELYPSIYAGGSGTRSGTSRDLLMPNQPRTTEVYHANLSLLAWELDFFGRLRSLSEKALQEYFATEQARSAAQILLISSVANGYLALAAERESLKLSEDTFKSQQEAYELVKRQFDQGDVAELEVRRARIPCEVARGDIARYKQRVSALENALQLLVGSPRCRNCYRLRWRMSPCRRLLPMGFRHRCYCNALISLLPSINCLLLTRPLAPLVPPSFRISH